MSLVAENFSSSSNETGDCRICNKTEKGEETLVNPCACAGKDKFVHMSCLLHRFLPLKKEMVKRQRTGSTILKTPPPEISLTALENLTPICPACKGVYVGAAAVDVLTRKLEVMIQRKHGRGVANASAELANVFKKQGRYEEALPHYRVSLQIHQDPNEPNHVNEAVDHCNIAFCLKSLGHRYVEEAEVHYKEAIKIRIRDLGPGHLDVATCQHNLAILLQGVHRFEEAIELAEIAAKIRIVKNGEGHVTTKLSTVLVERLKKDILRQEVCGT